MGIFDAIFDRVQQDSVPIYGPAADADSPYYYPADVLEEYLGDALIGSYEFAGIAIKTRSKVAKTRIVELLGYIAPKSFKRTQPKLPHANLDVYVQQANNLQIWNQELDAARRYVIIGLGPDESVVGVRVIAGADLVSYDTTGKLTKKFQASRKPGNYGSQLVNDTDTANFISLLGKCSDSSDLRNVSPVAKPRYGKTLSIKATYEALLPLVGATFTDPGMAQERNRGALIHREACKYLGLGSYADSGQFPDILSQCLEVKLQLARTVDLGLELPNALTPIASLDGKLSAADVRYALFYGERSGDSRTFTITALVVVSGAHFFEEFQQFGGRISNTKLQMLLPKDFYTS